MISLSHWNLPTTLLLKLLSKLKKQTKLREKRMLIEKPFSFITKWSACGKDFMLIHSYGYFVFMWSKLYTYLLKQKMYATLCVQNKKKCVIKVWRAIHFFHYSHCKNGKTPWKVNYLDIRVFVKMKCHENFPPNLIIHNNTTCCLSIQICIRV